MGNVKDFDFDGWATKNNIKCADGRTIMHNAFIVNDGMTVPLVWNHRHDTTSAVLGHCLLENRDEGVYCYGSFNNTQAAKDAKEQLQHGDITSLSIYANNLVQKGSDVLHGVIREVSLVLAGSNPGAFIESVLQHGMPIDEEDEEGLIYSGENIVLSHSLENVKKKDDEKEDDKEDDKEVEVKKEETKEVEVKKDEPKEEKESETKEVEVKKKESEEKEVKEELKKEDNKKSENDDKSEENKTDESEEDEDTKKSKKTNGGSVMAHSAEGTGEKQEKTIEEIINTMNDEQKDAMYAMIGAAVESVENGGNDEDSDEEDEKMKHNLFDTDSNVEENYLQHSMILGGILEDAKKKHAGSLRDMITDAMADGTLSHAIPTDGMDVYGRGEWRDNIPQGRPTVYGFNDPEALYPDPKAFSNVPEWIQRNQDWVTMLLGGVHRSPFSRIKSVFANITEDEARAKGYIKTHQKKEEIFSLLKRVTLPTTIYKKQRMDKDDVDDITDFDVVAWIKGEMRIMLNEEIARAILIGDGRDASSDDKVREDCIRPIASDVDLFTIKTPVAVAHGATGAEKADEFIDAVVRARVDYRGSGTPTLFTTEEWVTEMLLLKDGIGHRLYKTEAELATALRVSKIVTVEVMKNATIGIPQSVGTGTATITVDKPLLAIIVNPIDYNVGNDKGSAIDTFDDFDIDFNQYKWLMETRMSGCLVRPFSAISVYLEEAAG